MKKVFTILFLVMVCIGAYGTKIRVPVRIILRNPPMPGNYDHASFQCPLSVTYDPDTREIEITGDDSEGVEIQIFDDCGNWLITMGRTPCSYTLTTTRPDFVYVHMDSYDWSATAAIQVK